jgi:hypothetical protein
VFALRGNTQEIIKKAHSEKEIYAVGREIAEGIAQSIGEGMKLVDESTRYTVKCSNSKFSYGGNTWPVVDVQLIYRMSGDKSDNKITFTLLLESDADKHIVGTVKAIKNNGKSDDFLEPLNNTMFAETNEGTVEVSIRNGKIVIVEE